jgi:hypothetical protein
MTGQRALKAEAILAVKGMFAMCDAIGEVITADDLMDVIRLAVEDGHDMAAIQCSMMSMALERVGKEPTGVKQ